MIPASVRIKNGELPPRPGVYFMRDAEGKIMYIGKATSLKSRVSSYFLRPASDRIEQMVRRIASIDYLELPTAIEALMREAELIKKHQPHYNVMEKDDKSFVHLAFTNEKFPRPLVIRGRDLRQHPPEDFIKVFGPFLSRYSVEASLDALRPTFPWSDCVPGQKRRCFYRHLGLCPGVCTEEISSRDYRKIIRRLIEFLSGKRASVVSGMEKEMKALAKAGEFEKAAELRDRLRSLQHVRDFAVLKRQDEEIATQLRPAFSRLEAYDISNTSGKEAVASMTVWEDDSLSKHAYRKFKMRGVGPDDFAMMEEVIYRRLGHPEWGMPDLLVIDGGAGQVAAAQRALDRRKIRIPLVGLAKGYDRKQDVPIYDRSNAELDEFVRKHKSRLQTVRDEAHRFAVAYHRKLRGKKFVQKSGLPIIERE